MKRFIKPLLLGTIVLTLVSCKEDHEEHEVSISISNPTENEVFNAGDSVQLRGSVSSEDNLRGYTLTLKNTTQNTTIFSESSTQNGTSLNFTKLWVDTIVPVTDLQLIWTVNLEHAGETKTQKVNFRCN